MNKRMLIVGDLLAIAIVTFIGFATHREAEISFLPRMFALFLPLSISWFLLAPSLGLFQDEVNSAPRQLWRPALAALFTAPFAAMLRGFLLNAPVIPIFGLVLGLAFGLGMFLWRAIYYRILRKS